MCVYESVSVCEIIHHVCAVKFYKIIIKYNYSTKKREKGIVLLSNIQNQKSWLCFLFASYRRDSKNERQRANRQSFSVLADCWTLLDADVTEGPTLVDRSNRKDVLPRGGWEIARFAALKELPINAIVNKYSLIFFSR